MNHQLIESRQKRTLNFHIDLQEVTRQQRPRVKRRVNPHSVARRWFLRPALHAKGKIHVLRVGDARRKQLQRIRLAPDRQISAPSTPSQPPTL